MTDAGNVRRLSPPTGGISRSPQSANVTKLPISSRTHRGGTAASQLYLDTVSKLEDLAKHADLGDPKEFHDLLSLAVTLGANQRFIAYDQAKAPSMVSRWVSGEQTPMAHRRHGILASALVSLRKSIDDGSPVLLRKYHGRRSKRTLHPLRKPQ